MVSNTKKKYGLLILLPLVCMGLYYILQWQARISLEKLLRQKIPSHVQLDYDAIDLNILFGNIHFINPNIIISSDDQHGGEFRIKAINISLENVLYWKLFKEKKIEIEDFHINGPRIVYKKTDGEKRKKSKPIQLLKSIEVQKFHISNGRITLLENDTVPTLELDSLFLTLSSLKTNASLINKKIPFMYGNHELAFQNLYAALGDYEELTLEKFKLTETKMTAELLYLGTKYSKKELSKHIIRERDHLKLTIPSLEATKTKIGFLNDSVYLSSEGGKLNGLKLDIFRDKNVPDDFKHKLLYARMLKSLPFKISVNNLTIDNSHISYEEKVNEEPKAGMLTFEDLSGTIKNFSNLDNEKKNIEISLHSKLMGTADLNLNWSFNVQDTSQKFIATGNLSNLNTVVLNDFLTPNLRVKAEGEIEKMYFTISGDEHTAKGDVKMRYHDFKFKVLNKHRLGINKVLTFIGNLFIDDGSKADKNGYRYGAIEVERHKNKSFFNYLWISLQNGLLHVLSGNGQKQS